MILTLRNPSDKPQVLALDIGTALDLPVGAVGRDGEMRSVWAADGGKAGRVLRGGTG